MNKSSTEAQENIKSVIQRIATGPELSKNISRDEAKRSMSSGRAAPLIRELMAEILSIHHDISLFLKMSGVTQGAATAAKASTARICVDLSSRRFKIDELARQEKPKGCLPGWKITQPILDSLISSASSNFDGQDASLYTMIGSRGGRARGIDLPGVKGRTVIRKIRARCSRDLCSM